MCVYNCGPSSLPWSPVGSASFSLCEGGSCQGQWAVFRISFTLSCLFLSMLLVSSCTSRASVFAHRGFWFAKISLSLGVMAGTLFAPNDMFAYYAWIARFIAPGFLFYQMISFIDAGYTMNGAMVDRDDVRAPPP